MWLIENDFMNERRDEIEYDTAQRPHQDDVSKMSMCWCDSSEMMVLCAPLLSFVFRWKSHNWTWETANDAQLSHCLESTFSFKNAAHTHSWRNSLSKSIQQLKLRWISCFDAWSVFWRTTSEGSHPSAITFNRNQLKSIDSLWLVELAP